MMSSLALLMIFGACGNIQQVDSATRADICTSRLVEACKYTENPLAEKLTRLGEYVSLKHRFSKPDAVKVRYGKQIISYELHWHGEMIRFYSSGSKASVQSEPVVSRVVSSSLSVNMLGKVGQYLPSQMPRDRRLLGCKAIALGCNAFIDRDRVYFLPKFFRNGQDDKAFRRALIRTIDYDVGGLDLENLQAETCLSFGSLSAEIRDWLNTHPAYSGARQYDCREFPLPIQAKVDLAVKLYWQTVELALIKSARDLGTS